MALIDENLLEWATPDEVTSLRRHLAGMTGVPFVDFEDFASRAMWTKDEVTGAVRQFPMAQERYAYLRELVAIRKRCLERHQPLGIDKSRRMLLTWLLVGWYLYDVLTRPNVAHAVINKKLEDSAFLLGPERALFIYEHIPPALWPDRPELVCEGKCGLGYEVLRCPDTGSYIRAFPQGASQLRLYTLTWILFDEFAFQEGQEQAYTAAAPCVQGGGHIDIVTTPELGTWCEGLFWDR